MAKILVVDDDEHICEALKMFLDSEGHSVAVASNGKEAIKQFHGDQPNLVLMDVRMPGEDGLQVLHRMRSENPDAYVVIMTAYGTSQTSIEAMQLGAFDYLPKPLDLDIIKPLVDRALEAQTAGSRMETEPETAPLFGDPNFLVGRSPIMQEAFKLVGLLARNDAPVLLTGERGVGKEIVARTIHRNSPRKSKPFSTVFCRTLTDDLLGIELFGEETGDQGKGGTVTARGRLETGHGGTLFLADVDALSLPLQARLLRYLVDKGFERIGGIDHHASDTRVIATTSRNLGQLVQEGGFNEELFNHMRALAIRLPPLRERREDIPGLTIHFIRRFNNALNRRVKKVDEEVAALFQQYSWPANVEELKQVLQRACLLAPGELITRTELREWLEGGAFVSPDESVTRLEAAVRTAFHQRLNQPHNTDSDSPFHDIVDRVETALVNEVLDMTSGNQVRAAEILGVNRTTLRKKMRL
jgi:DNA-binding NtrC family response regulator